MKPIARYLMCVLCILVLLCVPWKSDVSATEELTIIGTVYAAAWDDNDNVTAVVIASMGGEYLVINNAVGQKLLGLDNQVVKASGVVGNDAEGNKTLTVSSYEVMPE